MAVAGLVGRDGGQASCRRYDKAADGGRLDGSGRALCHEAGVDGGVVWLLVELQRGWLRQAAGGGGGGQGGGRRDSADRRKVQ